MSIDWFDGKEFTSNFATKRVLIWTPLFQHWADKPIKVLEVGSYEGSSAVFFARFFPNAEITCVDTFWNSYEILFDKNIAEFGDRIEKVKGSGIGALDRFKDERRRFQLIYLDGGKSRDHALGLALLAWPMLASNGIMMWDDYNWGSNAKPEQRPHDGIDAFLALHRGEYRIRYSGAQMIIQKLTRQQLAKAEAQAKTAKVRSSSSRAPANNGQLQLDGSLLAGLRGVWSGSISLSRKAIKRALSSTR
ncbi:hypothetical protein GCM10017653_08450 [Ancylobacter defluvii]|uniref:Class I SAM-dependent methyltransferase n=2 Tax=Ancylobacter defluvii TaxID=1282440 RepID=A0A9W6JUC3_9HYPH|nr:hypothetical protein GCM10017653_08450 [Ancylobacter defluvii]